MKTYDHVATEIGSCRAHPWTDSAGDPRHRYYDLKRRPWLVRTALEDFVPWAKWPAIATFYRLVEWINGPDSLLESNDCAFTGPHPNGDPEFPKSIVVAGRVMILWRHLPYNLSRAQVDWLKGATHHFLSRLDEGFQWGAVGITVCATQFVSLPLPAKQQAGFQLMLSFWSWGDDQDEVWANLDRTLGNLWEALRLIARGAKDTINRCAPERSGA